MYYVPKSIRGTLSQAESYDQYFSNGHKNKFFFLTHSMDSQTRTIGTYTI